MGPSIILRVILILSGGAMMLITVGSLAKRRMNESFCLAWSIVSLALFAAGIVLRPAEWQKYISGKALALVLIIFTAIFYAAYFTSLKVSEITRKNQELAIQVSLLNQENERILRRLAEVTGKDVREL